MSKAAKRRQPQKPRQPQQRKQFKATNHGNKHPKVHQWNRAVIRSTEHGPAKFKPGTPYNPIQFTSFHNNANAVPIPNPPACDPDEVDRVWVKFAYIIGASEGEETKYVLIKRDCCFLHARPVTEHELRVYFEVRQLAARELT